MEGYQDSEYNRWGGGQSRVEQVRQDGKRGFGGRNGWSPACATRVGERGAARRAPTARAAVRRARRGASEWDTRAARARAARARPRARAAETHGGARRVWLAARKC